MEDVLQNNGKMDESSMLELTGKIMVVAIIVLFLVVVFVFFLHIYSKWFWNRRHQQSNNNNNTTRVNVTSILKKGLDPTLLKTLPVISFNPKEFKDGLECSVCLCDVSEGEKTRLLPKCNHGFHVECIDMWFQSHSTCPLCRNPVSKMSSDSTVETETELEENSVPTEVPVFPTNVLFWGDETQVSTLGPCLDESSLQGSTSSASQSACPPSSSAAAAAAASTSDRPCGSLVIDIPRQINEEEEEFKSPISTRFRSLKRLLSRDKRAIPFSPRIVDIEQGGSRSQS